VQRNEVLGIDRQQECTEGKFSLHPVARTPSFCARIARDLAAPFLRHITLLPRQPREARQEKTFTKQLPIAGPRRQCALSNVGANAALSSDHNPLRTNPFRCTVSDWPPIFERLGTCDPTSKLMLTILAGVAVSAPSPVRSIGSITVD
jgi:hypothetical protein